MNWLFLHFTILDSLRFSKSSFLTLRSHVYLLTRACSPFHKKIAYPSWITHSVLQKELKRIQVVVCAWSQCYMNIYAWEAISKPRCYFRWLNCMVAKSHMPKLWVHGFRNHAHAHRIWNIRLVIKIKFYKDIVSWWRFYFLNYGDINNWFLII
jgi:hypothetical protein